MVSSIALFLAAIPISDLIFSISEAVRFHQKDKTRYVLKVK